MASFSEWSDNKKNNGSLTSSQPATTPTASAGASSFSDWSNQKADRTDVSRVFNDINDFSAQITKAYTARSQSYQTPERLGAYKAMTDRQIDALLGRVKSAREYYSSNRAAVEVIYGKETADTIFSALDESQSYLENVRTDLENERSFWGQFGTEEAYNAWRKLQDYQDIPNRTDYAEKSRYNTTYRGGEKFNAWTGSYTDSGYDDILYDYINGDKTAQERQLLSDLGSYGNLYATTHSGWKDLPAETVGTFNYIYATEGPEAAYAYIDTVADKGRTGIEDFTLGTMKGSGLMSVSAALSKGLSGGTDALKWYDELNQEAAKAAVEQPALYKAGAVTGTLTMMLGISKGIGAIQGFSSLPALAQTVLSGAGSFGGVTALQEAGEAAAGNITTGQYLKDVGVSTLGGAAGGAFSGGIGQLGGAFLSVHGLTQNTLARTIVAGLSGTGFAAGNTGVEELAKYLEYPEGYEADAEQIAQDLLVAFAFSTLSYLASAGPGAQQPAESEAPYSSEFFNEGMSEDEARRVYRELAKQYHPDLNPGDADAAAKMAQINSDFDELLRRFASGHVAKAAEAYKTATTTTGAEAEAAAETFTAEVRYLQEAAQSGALATTEGAEAAEILAAAQAGMTGGVAASGLSQATPEAQNGTAPAAPEKPDLPALALQTPETAQNGTAKPQGLSLPSLEPVQKEPDAALLWTTPKGNDGWKTQYNGDIPIRDALQLTDQELLTSFEAEASNEGAGQYPIINAYLAAWEDVRQGTISPMAAAQLLSNIYKAEGVGGLQRLYNPATGNLYDGALETAKWIDTQHAEPPARPEGKRQLLSTKKSDWPATDSEWYVPNRKKPIAYSTIATSDSIGVMADEHPDDTIRELLARYPVYEVDGRKVLQQYINAGYGEQKASEWFSYNRKHGYANGPRTANPAPETLGDAMMQQLTGEAPVNIQNGGEQHAATARVIEAQSPVFGGQAGLRPAADTNALGGQDALYSGDAGGRYGQPGREAAGGLRGVRGGSKENRELTRQRQAAAMEQPLVSSADLGVRNGTEAQTLRVLPEADWDRELQDLAGWAYEKGIRDVKVVVGMLQVDTGSGPVSVLDIINKDTGELIIRGDSLQRSVSETGRHTVGHFITGEGNVRAFMEAVQGGYKAEAWGKLIETYRAKWAGLTADYEGMTEEQIELYVWEELLEDAFANVNNYGTQASVYHKEAVAAIEGTAGATEQFAGAGNMTTNNEPAGTESIRGPPDRYSYAGRNARNADSEALAEAERLEMQGLGPEDIRQTTGWFRGADGLWRFEIDDSGMEYRRQGDLRYMDDPEYREYLELWEKAYVRGEASEAEQERLRELDRVFWNVGKSSAQRLANGGAMLSDILAHEELFRNYPQLRRAGVRFDNLDRGIRGMYRPDQNEIILDNSLREAPEDTLIHEIQHAIQRAEGFARGANTEYWQQRLDEGFDNRTHLQRSEAERLQNLYDSMAAENPEFMRDMEALYATVPDVPRGAFDYDTLEQIEEDPVEWQQFDARRDELEEQYGEDKVWDFLDLKQHMDQMRTGTRDAYDLYRSTAGEIEARDAAARRAMTPEQRMATRPDIGDRDVVFAEDDEDEYAAEASEDSTGKALTQAQQEYFKDSKIRDEQGRLREVYHGTNSGEFSVFDWKETQRTDGGWFGRGFYFTFFKGEARIYGQRVLDAYLNIKNPFVFRDELLEYNNMHPQDTDATSLVFMIKFAEKFPELAKGKALEVVTGWDDKGYGVTKEIPWSELRREIEGFLNRPDFRIVEIEDRYNGNADGLKYEYQVKNGPGKYDYAHSLSYMSREEAERSRLDAAVSLLFRRGNYESADFHMPHTYISDIGNEFSEALKQRGYDGVLQTREGDEVVAFYPEQIKRSDNKNPTTNPDIRYSVEDDQDEETPVGQAITSAKTSIKQVPALFKDKNVRFGKTNIDIGGGRFNLATDYLRERGTENLVFDPYNRTAAENEETLRFLMDGGRADTATCANVLNVIAEPKARANVILEAAKSIKPDGTAYFMVYEGDGSGEGKETSAGWQNNRKTADYVGEIGQYFQDVQRKGKLIIGKNPDADLPRASWETQPGKATRYSVDNEGPAEYNMLMERDDVALGESDQTYTEADRPVDFTWAVVPADSLIVSNDQYGSMNPDYPAELQPRDRSRVASQEQIQKISRRLNPRMLAESPTAQNGAPIIRGDGAVIGGNARSAAILAAYESGAARDYEKFIRERGGRYGIDTAKLPERPVLVRVAQNVDDWPALAQELNASTTAAYSATEQAMTDAKKMDGILDLIVPNDDGDINTADNGDFIQAFLQKVVPESERGGLVTSGGLLSQAGLERAENAIFAYAYGDPSLMARYSESLDNDMKNVTNALAQSAPAAVALRAAIEAGNAYDVPAVQSVLKGLEIYGQAKQLKKTVAEQVAQMDLLEGDNWPAAFIAGFIERNKRSAKQLRTMFLSLYDEVADYGDPNQESLFGGETHDIREAVNGAIRRYEEATGREIERPNFWGVRSDEGLDGGNGETAAAGADAADGVPAASGPPDAGADGGGVQGGEPEGLSLPTLEEPEPVAAPEQTVSEAEQTVTEPKRPYPEGYNSVEEFMASSTARAEAARAERLRNISKEDFTGTPALRKLGVRLENSVGLYANIEQLKANDRAAKQIQRETRKAERRLDATEAERNFASGIAAGIYGAGDIPTSMDADKVMELADYYWAEQAVAGDRIRQQRAAIGQALEEKMEELFKDSDDFKPSRAIVLNYRTPERNMLHIFGDERGRAINEALFDPVAVNEAERFRFVNRMHDEVRTFPDKNGKQAKLTKQERAIVQQVIEGRAAAETVAGMETRGAIENSAQNIVNGEDAGDAATEFNLSREEQKLAIRYARWLQTEEAMRSGNVDTVKVEAAAKKYSELFNQFYDAINDFLVAHGYEPIGFIEGYAPHIQPENNQNLLNKAFNALGINTDVTRLPSNIAGLTGTYRPNKRWNPYFLQRTTDVTDFDIASAFESYVDYMSDVLYHTDDIMRVRQAAKHFRQTYAPDEIKNNLSWASELRYGSTEQKANFLRDQGVIDRATAMSPADVNAQMDEYVEQLFNNITKTTKYSDLVTWLDNYANILAGKQSMADRSPESMFGREVLNFGNKLIRTFAQANVAGNLSSMLNQTAQIPMIQAELGTRWTAAAIKDIITGQLRRGEWAGESDFLTGKKGIEYLVSTPGEMVVTAMFKPLEIMDSFVSAVAVRGKYLKEIHAGKDHKAAMKAADRFGKAVMGSRMKGSKPLAFNSKNPIYQMVNIFQIEAFNSWEHIKEDLPRDFRTIEKEQGKAKAARALAGVIVKALMLSFLMNRLAEKLYGGTPAPFDLLGLTANFIASGEGLTTNAYLETLIDNAWEQIAGERLFGTDAGEIGDEPFNWEQAWGDLAYNVSNDIPFLQNVAGLLGLGDRTLPMPDIYGGVSDLAGSIGKNGVASWDTGKALMALLAQVVPGGRQFHKTAMGAETVLRGGDFSGTGDNEKLKYPTGGDFWSTVQALMFGKYATEASNAYYAGSDSALSAKQTRLWRSLTEGGADPQAVYDAIQSFRDITSDDALSSYERGVQERELIRGLDLTDDQKLDMYRELGNADSRVEKFRAIMDTGLSFDQVIDIYNAYAELDANEGMKATEQATAFSKWVDQQGYKESQAETIKDQLRFWSIIPADASRYEKMTDAGLEAEDAYSLTETLATLEPEDGKSGVSDMQKYRAIAASDLGDGEKVAAIGSIMGTDMTTESGNPSSYAKMLNLLDSGVSLDEYLDLSAAGAVDGYLKYRTAAQGRDYGITPEVYIDFRETLPDYDADGNGSFTREEVKNAIDGMSGETNGLSLPSLGGGSGSLTNTQKAVLWQLYNKSWKARNNPYDSTVGQWIYDGLHTETNSGLPSLGGAEGPPSLSLPSLTR